MRTKQASTGVLLVLCAVLALTVGVATANAGGGNSADAKLCQKGGWQHLFTATGGSFASEEACVSYAAQGGTLTTLTLEQQWQTICQNGGGVAHSPWDCFFGSSLLSEATFNALATPCTAAGGQLIGSRFPPDLYFYIWCLV